MHPVKLEIPSGPKPVRQELNKIKLSALTLVETLIGPNHKTPPHIHDAASICLTLAGKGLEIIGSTRIVAQPGCVIVRAPQLVHSNQYGAVAHRGFMIELENKWLQSCRHISSVFEGHKCFSGGPVAALAEQPKHAAYSTSVSNTVAGTEVIRQFAPIQPLADTNSFFSESIVMT